jgi:hypothetical protein
MAALTSVPLVILSPAIWMQPKPFALESHLSSQPHQPLARIPRPSPQNGCYSRAGDKDVFEQTTIKRDQ